MRLAALIPLTAFAEMASIAAAPLPRLPTSAEIHARWLCDSVPASDVIRVADKQMKWVFGRKTILITIRDEEVIFSDKADGRSTENKSYHVDELIGGNRALDINPELVLYHNAPFVYWRETFQHSQYRQGLLSIDHDRLDDYCQGVGGALNIGH